MREPLPWPTFDPMPEGWLDDTPPEALAVLRRLGPARRVATARGLLRSARCALAAGVRHREPHLSEADVSARVRDAIRHAAG